MRAFDRAHAAADAAALGVDERVVMMRDGLVNYSAVLVSGIVGVLLLPLMLRGLGADSFGLWIAVLALVGTLGALDLGLGNAVTREVAASSGSRAGAAPFVGAAGGAHVALGIAGGLLVILIGALGTATVGLSEATRHDAPVVFTLGGLLFLSQHVLYFGTSVLHGLRRFSVLNVIVIACVLLRGAGTLLVLATDAGIVPIAAVHLATSGLMAILSLAAVRWGEPRSDLWFSWPRWRDVRAHVPFTSASQGAQLVSALVSETAQPLLVAAVLGASAVPAFFAAQRFPLAAGQISVSSAQVLFANAGAHATDRRQMRAFIEAGARWMLVLSAPLCAILFVLAPDLLRAWLGGATAEAVWVFRLTTVAVFAYAVGESSVSALWGVGAAPLILLVFAAVGLPILGFSLAAVATIGVVGAALGLCATSVVGSIVFVALASRRFGIDGRALIVGALGGLALPVTATAVSAWALAALLPAGWLGVGLAALAGATAYVAALYARGARLEERLLMREIAAIPLRVMRRPARA